MQILPAGVPRGLHRLKQRVSAAAANTPLAFIGMVLAIAVVFRIGIGAVKPVTSASDDEPAATSHVSAPVQQKAEKVAVAEKPAVSASAGLPVAMPEPEAPKSASALTRRKPRTHGKR